MFLREQCDREKVFDLESLTDLHFLLWYVLCMYVCMYGYVDGWMDGRINIHLPRICRPYVGSW
jgi:hypothetical protein